MAADTRFYFIGNLPSLDFVNTEIVANGEPVDLLDDFATLVEWMRTAGEITPASAGEILRRWGKTSEAKAAFSEAVLLRKALRTMAERLAAGKSVGQSTIDTINRVLASRPVYRQVEQRGSRYLTKLQGLTESPAHLLVPIAESAAWLLEHGDHSLVRRCENPKCVLYFYDTTKNRRRRWCSMSACGSRAKAAAYYRRSVSRKT